MTHSHDLQDLMVLEIPRMRRFALKLTRQQDAADDVVQESLEKAWKHRAAWRKYGSLRPWLLRIVYTTYLNARRRRHHHQECGGVDEIVNLACVDASQEERLFFRLTMQAMQHLPAEQRDVLLLVAVEGASYDQAALILDLPIGTVRSRLSRAREALYAHTQRQYRPAYLRKIEVSGGTGY